MLSPIFAADTKTIFRYNFIAPLKHRKTIKQVRQYFLLTKNINYSSKRTGSADVHLVLEILVSRLSPTLLTLNIKKKQDKINIYTFRKIKNIPLS